MQTQLLFVTGNPHKFSELAGVLPGLERVDLDLPEIQAVDSRVVIGEKLRAARQHMPDAALLVEDTALHLMSLNGFPGALVKWLLDSVGSEGIHLLCSRLGDVRAEARTVLGYVPEGADEPIFFDTTLEGTITAPRGTGGFGWDAIFRPEGEEYTLAELPADRLEAIKMRRAAAVKLAQHLDTGRPPP